MQVVDALKHYGFRDEIGHSLESIIEYQQMCKVVEAAQVLVQAKQKNSPSLTIGATMALIDETEKYNIQLARARIVADSAAQEGEG